MIKTIETERASTPLIVRRGEFAQHNGLYCSLALFSDGRWSTHLGGSIGTKMPGLVQEVAERELLPRLRDSLIALTAQIEAAMGTMPPPGMDNPAELRMEMDLQDPKPGSFLGSPGDTSYQRR